MDIITYDVLLVGSGASAFNAACRILNDGKKSVAMITENVLYGTSRNTGSDKQTYYKLNLGSDPADSVSKMAEDLFNCGCVDGDTAFCEAAMSVRCFMNLVELGVPFPCGILGEYTGYKTDHDPCSRASSAGPLTSKHMTELLQLEAEKSGIKIYDNEYVTSVLTDKNGVIGLTCVNALTGKFTTFRCRYVILATGGPAGIYADSVYPECHTGSSSLALNAGAKLQNMTEWQYGLASVNPRWNVSGTYMQVIPCFISVDENGNEREFLSDYFDSTFSAVNNVFLKGYQWPFDCKKSISGSSQVDIAVYIESKIKNRRIYLDYTKNPFKIKNFDRNIMSDEMFDYLSSANALSGTPFERLKKMNTPAAEHFLSYGIDLSKDRLEITLCSQHCNGGISVNIDWETAVNGLFAVGECAGTHGITRPGGSALNSGQVGSLRAAQKISADCRDLCSDSDFTKQAELAQIRHENLIKALMSNFSDINEHLNNLRMLFSKNCAAVRVVSEFGFTQEVIDSLHEKSFRISDERQTADLYRLLDTLTIQKAVLRCISELYDRTKSSRGSAIYVDSYDNLNFTVDCDSKDVIQEISLKDNIFHIDYRPVRPVPKPDTCFENIWKQYRNNLT